MASVCLHHSPPPKPRMLPSGVSFFAFKFAFFFLSQKSSHATLAPSEKVISPSPPLPSSPLPQPRRLFVWMAGFFPGEKVPPFLPHGSSRCLFVKGAFAKKKISGLTIGGKEINFNLNANWTFASFSIFHGGGGGLDERWVEWRRRYGPRREANQARKGSGSSPYCGFPQGE